ncbi:MAG: POTRA domain-containing protein, partial [Pseudomonadota bacterium]|nr:POTRA domain-containing protein [Pseudomonadota bacterium]
MSPDHARIWFFQFTSFFIKMKNNFILRQKLFRLLIVGGLLWTLQALPLFCSPLPASAAQENFTGEPIVEIVVLGNQKVTKDTITDKMKTKVGGQLSPTTLDQDIKDLFSLGFFDNLMINLKAVGTGVEVAVIVVEKPTISSIVIKGNKKIKRKELLKEITLHTFNILNEERLKESLGKMKAFYHEEGFYSVRIKSKTVRAGKNRIQV